MALQFVTISTRSINYHQFSFVLETPLRQLELHAASQDELERWTDAILAAQESHSRSAHGHAGRRTTVLQRVLRKGRSSLNEIRLGRHSRVSQSDAGACVPLRGGGTDVNSGGVDAPGELDAIGVVPEAEIDLTSLMANAHLRGLLAKFAMEHGADAEFKLLEEMWAAMAGGDGAGGAHAADVGGGWLKHQQQVAQLPEQQRKKLLRLSQTIDHQAFSPAGQGDATINAASLDAIQSSLRRSYTAASQRVEADLLPQFCQTEGFRQWLAEQQAADELAVSLAALVQQPAALRAFRDCGLGDAVLSESHYDLSFFELIERIHTQPLPVTELLKLARQAIAMHLVPGSPKLVAISPHIKDEIDAAMATLDAGSRGGAFLGMDGSSRLLVAFISAQLEASQRLSEPLRHFEATVGSGDAWRQAQEAELDTDCCTHWIYCKDGFNAFRAWLVETHAVRRLCAAPTRMLLPTRYPCM